MMTIERAWRHYNLIGYKEGRDPSCGESLVSKTQETEKSKKEQVVDMFEKSFLHSLDLAFNSSIQSHKLSSDEVDCYRSRYEDVSGFSNADVQDHYRTHGWKEGRNANCNKLVKNTLNGDFIPVTHKKYNNASFYYVDPVQRGRGKENVDYMTVH